MVPMQPSAQPRDALAAPFIGRERELDLLTGALDRSPPRGVTVWIVAGEAGIGKTRLTRELASRAEDRGWRTVWSQGWDGTGVPPYWPWAQVVRDLRGHATGTRLAAHLDLEDDPADQFELFDATARALAQETEHRPLLVVLDDLHLMDEDSLQLLGFLAAHDTTGRTVVVGTRRIDGVARPTDDVLGDLSDTSHHIPLVGLDLEAVEELLGGPLLAADAMAVTSGNPLFVEEILRAQQRSGEAASIDRHSLVGATRTRLRGVDPEVVACLFAVSRLGRHARHEIIATVLDQAPAVTQSLLDEAHAAGLLLRDEPLELAHPLFAIPAEEMLPVDRRRKVHRRAAQVLSTVDATASEIARHLVEAGPRHRRAAAVALIRAGDEAAEALAHHSAVDHLAEAAALLATVESPADPDFRTRCEVTLALAGARNRAEGRAAAEQTYDLALELAERTGDAHLIGRATARHGIDYFTAGPIPMLRATACRRALDLLPAEDSPLHATLLAQIAAAGLAGIDPQESRRTALAAERMARRVGDPTALGLALVARQVCDLGPSSLSFRLESAREIVALAERSDDADLAVHGRFLLKAALLEKGDLRELEIQLNEQQAHIGRVGTARWARHGLWFRCTQAMLDGNPAQVEEVAGEIGLIADRLQDPDGVGVYFGQLGVARWLQGRLVEMEDAYLSQFRSEPDEPLWPTVLAWLALQDGRRDVARGWASHFRSPSQVPQGMHTLLTLVSMADVLAELGSDEQVRDAWEALLPYADHVVPLAMGAGIFGTVARPLGRLAARMARPHEAIGHYRRSIAVAGRLDARPWLVEAQLELAAYLMTLGSDEHRAHAAALVTEVQRFERPGVAVFDARLTALVEQLDVTGGEEPAGQVARRDEPADASRPAVAINVLGALTVRDTNGDVARWTSRKARTLLKLLVGRAGGVISRDEVMAVLWPDIDPALLTNRLSVALSTVRRALDPGRIAREPLVATNDDGLWLVMDHPDASVEVDALDLLDRARRALDTRVSPTEVNDVLDDFTGVPFADDPFASWARPLRDEVLMVMARLLRRAVELAADDGDHFATAEAARRLLDLDPFDESAHRARVRAMQELGAHGLAAQAQADFTAAMTELTGGQDVRTERHA